MLDEEIIEKFNQGYSLSFLIDYYLKSINLNQRRLYYNGYDYVINKDYMSKNEAKKHVEELLVDYLVSKKKGVK